MLPPWSMITTPSNTPTSAIRQSQILPDSSRSARAGVGRPKAGARYKEPLDYAHPCDSMKRFAQLLALRYDMAHTRHSYHHDLQLLNGQFQSGDNGFGNRYLISGGGLRRGAGPEGRLSANRMRHPESCGARSSPEPAASTVRRRSMNAAGSGLLQILQLLAESGRSSKPS